MINSDVLLIHNILWAKYKGLVFSALSGIFDRHNLRYKFIQIAETDNDRIGLAKVDLSYHRYDFELLFKGSYAAISRVQLYLKLSAIAATTHAKVVLLPGYHLPEYWLMLFILKMRQKKIGVFCDSTSYENSRHIFKDFLKSYFFRNCHIIFGYGRRSRDYLISLSVPPEKIRFRCQAAALPHNYCSDEVLLKRYTRTKTNDEMIFLYVGRLSVEKGLNDLLFAFKDFLIQRSDAVLRIVGTGPLEQSLRALCVDLKIDQKVIFVGARSGDDLAAEYLNASCLVLPSHKEPWGLVVNEALSYGCPVIVSHTCGCTPELVQDGVTGFSFERGNLSDLTQKMMLLDQWHRSGDMRSKECLLTISEYTPENAALQIYQGINFVFGHNSD